MQLKDSRQIMAQAEPVLGDSPGEHRPAQSVLYLTYCTHVVVYMPNIMATHVACYAHEDSVPHICRSL
jgi:hypothetical protein